jgi:hypothetical protein
MRAYQGLQMEVIRNNRPASYTYTDGSQGPCHTGEESSRETKFKLTKYYLVSCFHSAQPFDNISQQQTGGHEVSFM